jgi:hypothetical protein
VDVPVNRVRPDPGDVLFDLLYHRFHGRESSE